MRVKRVIAALFTLVLASFPALAQYGPSSVGWGTTPVTVTALAGTVTTLKATRGQLFWFNCTNTTAATAFIEFFDATSVTLGTTTPKFAIQVPASANVTQNWDPSGVNFFTAIKAAAVTAYNGSTGAAQFCSFGVY